jgi:polar amino acid transport system substrate-binding protein
MKRLLLGLFVLSAVAITGCGALKGSSKTGATVSASPVLDRIMQRRQLLVGMSGDQAPLNMTTRDGQLIGLEVDLARAAAAAMGVELRLVTMPFGNLLEALDSGEVDMIISGMTMTPKRNLQVAFVGPYFVSGKALLTKSKAIAEAKDSEVINKPSVTLAALRGSTSQIFVEKGLPRAKAVLTNDYEEAVRMVIDGEVDALVADFPFCAVATFRHPQANLQTLVAPFTFEPLGVALPPGDPLFVNWTGNFLLALEGSGALAALAEQWFKDGSWLDQLP